MHRLKTGAFANVGVLLWRNVMNMDPASSEFTSEPRFSLVFSFNLAKSFASLKVA